MKRRGFTVKIHPAGAAVFAAAFLLCDSHLVLSTTAALLLHEGAHLLTMRLCGMRNCTVELTPFGGMADTRDFDAYPAWKRMLSSAAGVAASALAAWACLRWAPRTALWQAFFQCNLSLALFNCLPAWPLDGARVLAALAGCVGWEASVKRLLSWVTQAMGVTLAGIGLYGIWHGVINPTLLIAGPYLCYAARAEIVSDKVRRLDGIGKKLNSHSVMPVAVWAGNGVTERFGTLLGRMQTGRYHVLLDIDPASGRIQKCWTENEMLHHTMMDGSN